jgi:hypothetical protein
VLVEDGVLVVSVRVEMVGEGCLTTVVQEIRRSELIDMTGINRRYVFIFITDIKHQTHSVCFTEIQSPE